MFFHQNSKESSTLSGRRYSKNEFYKQKKVSLSNAMNMEKGSQNGVQPVCEIYPEFGKDFLVIYTRYDLGTFGQTPNHKSSYAIRMYL